jgi:ubiquinone biosynthesis protein UbiJ
MEALGDGRITVDGDAGVLVNLVGLLGRNDPNFAIVTP